MRNKIVPIIAIIIGFSFNSHIDVLWANKPHIGFIKEKSSCISRVASYGLRPLAFAEKNGSPLNQPHIPNPPTDPFYVGISKGRHPVTGRNTEVVVWRGKVVVSGINEDGHSIGPTYVKAGEEVAINGWNNFPETVTLAERMSITSNTLEVVGPISNADVTLAIPAASGVSENNIKAAESAI